MGTRRPVVAASPVVLFTNAVRSMVWCVWCLLPVVWFKGGDGAEEERCEDDAVETSSVVLQAGISKQ